ncbi:MAG: hypothetical protein R3F11_32130 [Verrucomicrobiales bacterium]
MTLTIDLDQKTEERLKSEAEEVGVEISDLAAKLISERFSDDLNGGSDQEEQRLIRAIARGWPEEKWSDYRALVARRNRRDLSERDKGRLLCLSDELEGINERRIRLLIRLAELRGQSLRDVMAELEIAPRDLSE